MFFCIFVISFCFFVGYKRHYIQWRRLSIFMSNAPLCNNFCIKMLEKLFIFKLAKTQNKIWNPYFRYLNKIKKQKKQFYIRMSLKHYYIRIYQPYMPTYKKKVVINRRPTSYYIFFCRSHAFQMFIGCRLIELTSVFNPFLKTADLQADSLDFYTFISILHFLYIFRCGRKKIQILLKLWFGDRQDQSSLKTRINALDVVCNTVM